jgi:hypothetical protein
MVAAEEVALRFDQIYGTQKIACANTGYSNIY